MALNDIRIWKQTHDGTAAYPLITGGETFLPGEVLVVDATGYIGEAGDDPATVTGISASSSQGKTATGVTGAVPVGTLITIYKPTPGQLFITNNFGAAAGTTPTVANVGDTAGFDLTAGVWSVDTAAANAHVEIVAVLDANGAPLGDSNIRTTGTGASVVFGFLT